MIVVNAEGEILGGLNRFNTLRQLGATKVHVFVQLAGRLSQQFELSVEFLKEKP